MEVIDKTYSDDSEYNVSYDKESGLFRVNLSEFVEYDPNCEYSFVIYTTTYNNLKTTSGKRIFLSEDVNGNDLRQGYDSGFYELKGAAYISGIIAGEKTATANFIDLSGRKIPEENFRYQWQKSRANAHLWDDIKGATKQTYTPTVKDIGSDLRVQISAKDYFNYAVSELVSVGKMPIDKKPVTPQLAYKNGSISVTNSAADQEYIISNKLLSKVELEEQWPAYNSLETGIVGERIMYGSEYGKTSYVFTRIRETETTLPSDDVAMAYAYCGETTIDLSLRTLYASMTEDRGTGVYKAYQDETMQLTAAPTDSKNTSFGGVYGKDWKCTKSDGTAYSQFYADSNCQKPVDDNTQYKSVYVPLKNTGSQIAFSATSGGSTATKLVSVGYAGYGGIIVPLESLLIPNVTVKKGTREHNLPAFPDPIDAYTGDDLLSFHAKTEDGAPVVGLYPNGKLYVNAEYASVGEYQYDVLYETQNGTQKTMCYFYVTVVENTQEAEALSLSANAILLAPGETFNLIAVISPVGAKANVTWKSNNTNAAKVDGGKVTVPEAANAGAEATITATTDSGLTDTCIVTVAEKKENEKQTDNQSDKQSTGLKNPFVDVKEGSYYYDAVLWAYYAKPQITNGIDATHFGPNATVTRGQTVTFLWRAMGEPEPKTAKNPFADIKKDDYYYKAVLWAVEKGITVGTDSTHFSPDLTCSTAHIITFLYRTLGEGSDGWYEEAGSWAKSKHLSDNTGREVSPNVDCPRCDVVTFLYRTVK